MRKVNIRALLVSIAIFVASSFLVHLIFNPDESILSVIGYGIFAGMIAGVAFYFIDKNK